MTRTGDKVETIISCFSSSMAGAVLAYLFNKGIDNVKEITDDDIKKMEGNMLMTQDFVQSLVRTARNVAQSCDLFDDIIPFVICKLPNISCQTKANEFWEENESESAWNMLQDVYGEEIEDNWGYEWDEVGSFVVNSVVTDVRRKESE